MGGISDFGVRLCVPLADLSESLDVCRRPRALSTYKFSLGSAGGHGVACRSSGCRLLPFVAVLPGSPNLLLSIVSFTLLYFAVLMLVHNLLLVQNDLPWYILCFGRFNRHGGIHEGRPQVLAFLDPSPHPSTPRRCPNLIVWDGLWAYKTEI